RPVTTCTSGIARFRPWARSPGPPAPTGGRVGTGSQSTRRTTQCGRPARCRAIWATRPCRRSWWEDGGTRRTSTVRSPTTQRSNAVRRRLYFHADGALSFDPPPAADGSDQFTSDPTHPVPYRPRPVELTYSRTSRWRRWETEDQRFVDGRPDVLTWQTPPLTADVSVAGDVVAHLYASTTGSDADWVGKLIDVYPDTVPGRP